VAGGCQSVTRTFFFAFWLRPFDAKKYVKKQALKDLSFYPVHTSKSKTVGFDYKMFQGEGVRKVPKKCHELFECDIITFIFNVIFNSFQITFYAMSSFVFIKV
jgi:hypothetical protein